MTLPELQNGLVVGDDPLVGNDEPLRVDKGGSAVVGVPPLVDWEGVFIHGSFGSIWPGCMFGALASRAVTNLQLTNLRINIFYDSR